MLFDTQQFTSSLVFAQVQDPLVYWPADYKQLTIEGETLGMDDFRRSLVSLLTDGWAAMGELSGGRKFATKVPDTFKDNLRNHDLDYSFLSHGPFTETPNALLVYLVEESEWDIGTLDANGRICWNVPTLHNLLGKLANINRLISLLCFITPSPNSRVQQFIDNKFRNGDRDRNLIMLSQAMVNMIRGHKMTNQTGLDVCIPAFYPPTTQDIVFEYLAGGFRDLEEMFGGVVYGPEAKAAYRT
jgi:hypothetical protein